MAYILENRNSQCVRVIADLCSNIYPTWRDELSTKTEEEAIKECSQNLQKLVSLTCECRAIFFNEVCFRTEYGDHEKKDIVSFNIRHKNSSIINTDARVMPADEGISDFYLLYAQSIYHIILNPASRLDFNLPIEDENAWDISTAKVQEMMNRKWDKCFVSGSYSWTNVIPIPTPKT